MDAVRSLSARDKQPLTKPRFHGTFSSLALISATAPKSRMIGPEAPKSSHADNHGSYSAPFGPRCHFFSDWGPGALKTQTMIQENDSKPTLTRIPVLLRFISIHTFWLPPHWYEFPSQISRHDVADLAILSLIQESAILCRYIFGGSVLISDFASTKWNKDTGL